MTVFPAAARRDRLWSLTARHQSERRSSIRVDSAEENARNDVVPYEYSADNGSSSGSVYKTV